MSLSNIASNLFSKGGKAQVLSQNDNDVVIVAAVRSAITKGMKGGFKDTRPEEYLSAILSAVWKQAGIDPALIEDIAVGNVLPPGGGALTARMAALAAGIPESVPVSSLNRQCSSGLQAVNTIAAQIASGQIDIGIGAGVESMTFGFFSPSSNPEAISEKVLAVPKAQECLLPMGITSENVSKDFGIPRQTQDEFAAKSFNKAAAAQKQGKFKNEILPITVKYIDPKTKNESEIVVDKDDGIREGVTAQSLGKLKPSFAENGCSHAGNSSQVSDGAAAVLLARRSAAKKLNLPILGKFVGASVVGVPPRIMGVGPAYAIPKLLEKHGITKDDVDFYEINEAFASQALYSIDKIGIPHEKVNPWGGGIALGHPLGCTGARQIVTGLSIAEATNQKIFVTSMCIGTGMGMAALFVSEQN